RAKVQPGQFVGEPGFDRFDSNMQTLGYLVQHEFNDTLTLRHALRRYNADVVWDYSQVNTSVSAAGLLQRAASIRREHSSGTTSDTSLEWRIGQGALQHTLLVGVDTYDKRYTSHRFTGTMQAINLLAPRYGMAVVPNFATDNGSDLSSRQWGVYLQDQIKFQERWVMLAGLRHDSALSDTTTLRTGAVSKKDDSKTTGRAGLVYLAPNGSAPYLSYSQSFYPADGTARNGSSFVPTEGEQWEAGVRWQPVGSQTLLSAALYRLTQNNALTVDPVDSRYNVQTGQVRSQGFELEARHTLSSNLSVRAAYTYADARTTQDNVAANVGMRTVGVPRHALALWSDYKLAGFGLSAWRVGAGVRAQDQTITTSPGTPTSVPGYGMVDLMLGWAPDARWDFTIRIQNATDRSYVFCNTACRYGNMRTIIAALNYQW
ncbi:MAG: TonB-dependent receptor, partial [Proteobacteria bacterium]